MKIEEETVKRKNIKLNKSKLITFWELRLAPSPFFFL